MRSAAAPQTAKWLASVAVLMCAMGGSIYGTVHYHALFQSLFFVSVTATAMLGLIWTRGTRKGMVGLAIQSALWALVGAGWSANNA